MNYFDLHCDTPFELYKKKADLYSNNLAVSLEKYVSFERKAQVFAVWCEKDATDDEAYLDFRHISGEFREQTEKYSDFVTLCTDEVSFDENTDKLRAILSVEDARLLGGDLSRLSVLYEAGVRLVTLCWQGESVIGGAYDTEAGLTPFGFEVLKECENLGIIVDVSHLSEKSFWDVAGKATKPFCATHSNSAMLYAHRRNLSDTQLRTIAASGGIVGVNFVGKHLSSKLAEQSADENSVYEAVCSHIEHFLSIAPESVCIGSDFDGTPQLTGLEDCTDVKNLRRALSNRGTPESAVDNVFYNNAQRFFADFFEKKN